MAGVKEMQRLAEANKNKTLRVFNPHNKDFTVKYHNKEYTIKSGVIEELPFHLAKHMANHLADFILNHRKVDEGWQKKKDKLLKEILI